MNIPEPDVVQVSVPLVAVVDAFKIILLLKQIVWSKPALIVAVGLKVILTVSTAWLHGPAGLSVVYKISTNPINLSNRLGI